MAEQEDDKPGMGLSGAVVGAGAGLVGAGAVAGIAQAKRNGQLTDEARKHIKDGISTKAANDAKKAFDEANKGTDAAANYVETMKSKIAEAEKKALDEAIAADEALAAQVAGQKAEEVYKAGMNSHTKKAAEEAKEAFKKANAGAAEDAIHNAGAEAYGNAEKAFKTANPDAAKFAESVAAKATDVKAKAVETLAAEHAGVAAQVAKKTPTEVLAAGAEHAAASAAKVAEAPLVNKILKPDVAKSIAEEAGKAPSAAADAGTKAVQAAEEAAMKGARSVKDASFIKKPFVAFSNMSGKGKALAIGVGAVLAVGGAMWMKARRQNAWQDRIDAERASAAVAAPQAAR